MRSPKPRAPNPAPQITLTIDLEDPTERYDADGRYVAMTRRILDLCDEFRRRATFFIVGRVAEAAPQLIQDIARRGHEIAFHSHTHVSLTQEIPARFRRETAADKDRIEQLAGRNLIGFRAPRFSLTSKSLWALDILGELGFRYSSSVMPTILSLFGLANAPRTPFLWPNGMIELPLPVMEWKHVRVPYLGGIYLYAMPFPLARRWAAHAPAKQVLWTYAHPYDFDRAEKFQFMPHTSFGTSFILWTARKVAEKKIRKLLSLGAAPPLAERIETVKSLPRYAARA